MRVEAIGRQLLIRMETDTVEERTSGGIIKPREVIDKEKGQIQVSEVLSVGDGCFDDQPWMFDDGVCTLKAGDRIVTAKYPGQAIDHDKRSSDLNANKYRFILDTEVRGKVGDKGVELV